MNQTEVTLVNIGNEIKQADAELKAMEKRVQALKDGAKQLFETIYGHQGATCGAIQRIIQVRTDYDADGVRKVIKDDEVYNKVHKDTIVNRDLTEAIKFGVISAIDIAPYCTTKEIDMIKVV